MEESRFTTGTRICARRSGHASESVAEVLAARAAGAEELYWVRWEDGIETYYVPGHDAHDRRVRDLGPPPGQVDRRRS